MNIYEAVFVNFIASVGLVFSFGRPDIDSFKISWLFVSIGVLLLRAIDGYLSKQNIDLNEKQAKRAIVRFSVGLILSSVVWSAYIIKQFMTSNDVELAITVMVVSTIISGSLIVISASRKLSGYYPLIVLLPGAVVGFFSEDQSIRFLASVVLIFVLIFYVTARKSSRYTSAALGMKNYNARLLKQLNQANTDLEDKVKARTEKIYELSIVDPLTKLQNRSTFIKNLDAKIEQARKESYPLSIMFIDLDGFKKINDTQGHELGDKLLQVIAGRLSNLTSDSSSLCRWGGDEFLFALKQYNRDDAVNFANGLIETLSTSAFIDHKELEIGATVGIAIFPDHGSDAHALVAHSDVAMYHQKKIEVGMTRVFDEAIKAKTQREEFLRQHLMTAEHSGNLFVHYQPIVDAVEGTIISFEALMRLRIDGDMVSPDEFIPIAENQGLISGLGNWILRKACSDAAKWQPIHKSAVSVNVSVIQLQEDDFCEMVENTLLVNELSPASLHLEITESVFSQNSDVMRERVKRLQEIGIKVSIDDFGTGYSSLSQLQKLAVDCVKIDRTFVETVRAGGRTIIEATLQIARALNYSTIAEGIETQDQLDVLNSMGVKQFQGYYFSKPMAFDDLMIFNLPDHKPHDIDDEELRD